MPLRWIVERDRTWERDGSVALTRWTAARVLDSPSCIEREAVRTVMGEPPRAFCVHGPGFARRLQTPRRLCTNTGHRDAVTQTHACHIPRDSTDTVNPPHRTLSGCAECVFVCVHLRAFLVGSPCVCRAGTHPSPASRCGACVGGDYCDVFRVYRPPSPPCGYHVGSLTPTQPRRVTNPTQVHRSTLGRLG